MAPLPLPFQKHQGGQANILITVPILLTKFVLQAGRTGRQFWDSSTYHTTPTSSQQRLRGWSEFATWGKEFGREEEVRRRPARAVLSLLACKGPGPLQSLVAQSLVAQSNVDGLVAHCSLLGLCTWRWPTKSSSYEICMNLPISGD